MKLFTLALAVVLPTADALDHNRTPTRLLNRLNLLTSIRLNVVGCDILAVGEVLVDPRLKRTECQMVA